MFENIVRQLRRQRPGKAGGGVSIVYQAGPALVSELKRHTLGADYRRLDAIGACMSVSRNSQPLQVN
ncbi:hypothetical protein [Mesorhizobium sp. M0965]|uniref:hypothetical protein n=1 Tax=Mesorhizobium sp. M0965 TaxID=2957036 RepID=UPI003337BF64